MLTQGEEILHHSAPIRDIWRNRGWGAHLGTVLFGFFALVLVALTIASLSFSDNLLVHVFLIIMTSIFVLFVLNMLLSPSRVNRKLNRCDFIITNLRFILCEEGKLRSIYWKDSPDCALRLHPDGSGNITIIDQKSFTGKMLNGLGSLAKKVVVAECLVAGENIKELDKLDFSFQSKDASFEEYRGADMKLNGLFFIPQAEAVYKLVHQLNSQP